MESSGLSDESANKTSKQKKNVLSAVFDVISGVFTPILPAIAGAGMIKGLVALAVTFGWMSEKSQTHSILTAVGGKQKRQKIKRTVTDSRKNAVSLALLRHPAECHR